MPTPLEPISFGDATQIFVPNSIHLMTPYVLLEQEDWFEEEIKFVRKLIKPGMTLIDIGANYGVYTLSMAKCLAGSGKLVAFEPTSAVANALRQSIALNQFNTIELRQCALSDHLGEATFHTNDNAELNSLHADTTASGQSETVQLTTLDASFPADFPQVDFIKLDAEGEEGPIIDGGKAFFARQSPLVMYELKHGNTVNEALIGQFAAIGFKNFVLMPGLDVLVPFEMGQAIDGYQLNLFSCRDDRAEILEQQGFLLRKAPTGEMPKVPNATGGFARLVAQKPMLAQWPGNAAPSQDADYQHALDLYASFCLREGTLAECAQALFAAHQLLEKNSTPLHALLRVRTALAIGQRALAVTLLKQLIDTYISWGPTCAGNPLLPASPRFELVETTANPINWLFASLLEQYEKSCAFSSYFTGNQNASMLNYFFEMGFSSPELLRRISLMQARAAQQVA